MVLSWKRGAVNWKTDDGWLESWKWEAGSWQNDDELLESWN